MKLFCNKMEQSCNKLKQSWDFFNEKVCYDISIKIYQKPPSFYKEIANRGYLFLCGENHAIVAWFQKAYWR